VGGRLIYNESEIESELRLAGIRQLVGRPPKTNNTYFLSADDAGGAGGGVGSACEDPACPACEASFAFFLLAKKLRMSIIKTINRGGGSSSNKIKGRDHGAAHIGNQISSRQDVWQQHDLKGLDDWFLFYNK
jgi:hypothetical protein